VYIKTVKLLNCVLILPQIQETEYSNIDDNLANFILKCV